jgi:hypothetical protein
MSMTTSLSNLLSDTPISPVGVSRTPKKRIGRPTKEMEEQSAREAEESVLGELPHYSVFRKPVGITFIALVMGKQPRQIAKRLEKCPVAEWMTHQGKQHPLYDFMTAMGYLVPPKGDIEDWFAQQNQASLPPQVSKAFWDSMNGRIRAMQKAGQLWHDDDVMALLGRVLMMIKSETQNWVEDIPDNSMLTNEQYNWITDQVNELMVKVKNALVDAPKQFATASMGHTILEEIEDAKSDGFDEGGGE